MTPIPAGLKPVQVAVCIPTLNQYDRLCDLLTSLAAGTLLPCGVWIIDNGRRLTLDVHAYPFPVVVYKPRISMGLAESWNWFITAVGGARMMDDNAIELVITNDDLTFETDALERLAWTPGPFVTPMPGQAFSCFKINRYCIDAVGLFDETISPGYAYFEDDDYAQRMKYAGVPILSSTAVVHHHGSATLKAFGPAELEEHHRKFRLAQQNYVKKWGFLPRKENLGG